MIIVRFLKNLRTRRRKTEVATKSWDIIKFWLRIKKETFQLAPALLVPAPQPHSSWATHLDPAHLYENHPDAVPPPPRLSASFWAPRRRSFRPDKDNSPDSRPKNRSQTTTILPPRGDVGTRTTCVVQEEGTPAIRIMKNIRARNNAPSVIESGTGSARNSGRPVRVTARNNPGVFGRHSTLPAIDLPIAPINREHLSSDCCLEDGCRVSGCSEGFPRIESGSGIADREIKQSVNEITFDYFQNCTDNGWVYVCHFSRTQLVDQMLA